MDQNPTPRLLALTTAQECVELIRGEADDAPEQDVPGLTSALECLRSLDERDTGHFTGTAEECVELILQRAAVAPEADVPGFTSALRCVLSFNERDATQFVAAIRRAR